LVFILAALAAAAADYGWYRFGRRRGSKVLRLLCSISLNPDSCVRNTQATFEHYGLKSLMVSKFVPGLNTIAPPMAGMLKRRAGSFCCSIAWAMLWSASAVLVGFIWHRRSIAIPGGSFSPSDAAACCWRRVWWAGL